MNTDKHGAAQPQPKKNLTAETHRTRRSSLGAHASSVLWLWRRPSLVERAGILLACIWNLDALLLVHRAASHFGWWTFQAERGLFLGLPVDLYLGWALLWGAIPALAFPRL